jgi:hypothetical protein
VLCTDPSTPPSKEKPLQAEAKSISLGLSFSPSFSAGSSIVLNEAAPPTTEYEGVLCLVDPAIAARGSHPRLPIRHFPLALETWGMAPPQLQTAKPPIPPSSPKCGGCIFLIPVVLRYYFVLGKKRQAGTCPAPNHPNTSVERHTAPGLFRLGHTGKKRPRIDGPGVLELASGRGQGLGTSPRVAKPGIVGAFLGGA